MILKIIQDKGEETFIPEERILSIESKVSFDYSYHKVIYKTLDGERDTIDRIYSIGYPYNLVNDNIEDNMKMIRKEISEIQKTISFELGVQNKLLEEIKNNIIKKNQTDDG